MKRRHLLAGAAALPFSGIGVDVGASYNYGTADDPAVRAFHIWRDAWQALDSAYRHDDDEEKQDRLHDVEWAARKALAEAVATTPAGIVCQLRVALDTFGELEPDADPDDPESYDFNGWKDEFDGKLMRNLLAGAQRLA